MSLSLKSLSGIEIGMVLTILVWGCSPLATSVEGSPPDYKSPPPKPASPAFLEGAKGGAGRQPEKPQPSPSLGQELPITAQATIKGSVIKLEVPSTPEQQALGLMYRPSLADDRGMLFPFNPPRPVSFWMPNVLIHLDMIFVRDGEVKAIAADVPPCTAANTKNCPTYGPPSNTPIDHVIELRGGRAAELGLKVGDRLSIQFLATDSNQSDNSPP